MIIPSRSRSGPSRDLQGSVADCGVGRRHRVEAMISSTLLLSAPRATSHITISIPSAPASRMNSIWRMLLAFEASSERLCRKARSKSLLMRSCALAGNLVRHAPRPKITTRRSSGKDFNRLADCLAEIEAAIAARRREQHHVHGERNDLAGPFLGLAEHQAQRHGEPWSTSILFTTVRSKSS